METSKNHSSGTQRVSPLGAFRWVPAGRHRTSPDAPTVTVERGFWCAETPITHAVWESVMGSNPSEFCDGPDAPHRPVEMVSWDDVQTFLQQAAERDGLPYRLLTADEWERAALGGACEVDSANAFVGAMPTLYAGSDDIDAVAWHAGNSGGTTHPVGQKQPNGYGLCDMSGNVWEWTSTASGSYRVYRGGGWGSAPVSARVAFRGRYDPGFRYYDLGLRVALDAAPISEREAIARYLEAEANLHAEAAETEGDPVHARIARRIVALVRRVREGAGL